MTDPVAFLPPFQLILRGLRRRQSGTHGRTVVDDAFLDFLIDEFARLLPFDAAFYAASYPDIAAALASGAIIDGHAHFLATGFREGRQPCPAPFDAAFYLASNPDLAASGAGASAEWLERHFIQSGHAEGRAGHPDSQADAARWHRAAGDAGAALAVRSLAGVRVQPFLAPVVDGPPRGFRGGPVLGDDAAAQLLRHRRNHVAVDSFPPMDGAIGALSGDYVYGGPVYAHFGHVMGEMIHRILPARHAFACRRLLLVDVAGTPGLAGFDAVPPAMQAALRFLDVAPADVTVMRDVRVVERLHIAQQGSELPNGPAPAYLRMLADYTPARLDALHDGHAYPARLYVSRSRLTDGGLLLGERYLEQILQSEGWAVLHPQEHSLTEQMQHYRRAEKVIFTGGSACHGTELFGTAGLAHAVLLPRGHAPDSYFEAVLRPRAIRFDTLPSATVIGSIVTAGRTGAVLDYLGVSLLNLPALAQGLAALGLADCQGLDAAGYRQAAIAELDAHVLQHCRRVAAVPDGTLGIVDDDQIIALRGRCLALLG